MNILLVYPRWNYPTFGELQEPLGIMSVGAALKQAGHEVRLIDLAVTPIEEVDRAVPNIDLAGISSSTVLFGRARRVMDRIKAMRPEVPVVLGGPHATVQPEEAIIDGFDFVVRGEGEHTAVELAERIEKNECTFDVPGIVTRWEDGIINTRDRAFEPDIDVFPDPDRTLPDYPAYFQNKLTHVGLMSTRGCPWNCLFCKPMQDKLFGRKIRRRSIPRIVAEMSGIARDLGKRQFVFKDDTFVLGGVEWFAELERELRAAGLSDIAFSCQARVDQIDRPLLEQMKRCGLEGIAFGVESGSQKVLDFYRKQIKVEQTIATFDLVHEMGLGTHAFIMLGAPVETREDLEATVNLVKRIQTKSVSVSITTPAPGSDLHAYAKENGLFNLKNHEDSDYQYNRRPLNLPHLSIGDLAWAEKEILDAVPTGYFKEQLRARVMNLQDENGDRPANDFDAVKPAPEGVAC